jgi:biopolymer transport protein ExbD
MRMTARRRSGLLELSEMRLPLIALIDVILFLLMYFLLAGSLESEERELATTLGSGSPVHGDAGGFTPQVVEVTNDAGRAVFRLGTRTAASREALADLLRGLPKEPGIVVRVADDAPVEAAAAAVQACRDAGFARIAYQPGRKAPPGQDSVPITP